MRDLLRLIRFDMRMGARTTRRSLILSAVLALSLHLVFLADAVAHGVERSTLTLGDAFAYLLAGMVSYATNFSSGDGKPFHLPVGWLLMLLLLMYSLLMYPHENLRGIGQDIMVRSGRRGTWWLAKCLWVMQETAIYWLVLMGTMALCALTCGEAPTLGLSPGLSRVLDIQDVVVWGQSLEPTLALLLPVSWALGLLQLACTLTCGPIVGYAVTIAVLFLSAFLTSPMLIGNYLMVARSASVVVGGVDLAGGLALSIGVMLASVLVGGLAFCRRDLFGKGVRP